MVRTAIDIPEEEMAALEAKAERESRPKDDLIREAITRYVSEDCRPKPQAVGIVGDTEVTSTNYRDWLRENWPRSIGMIKEDDGSLRSDNVDEWLKEHWRPE
jgi:hypothetical protein